MKKQTVLITGGAGYVGAVLVPKLLEHGYSVRVLDLFLYGEQVFGEAQNHPHLKLISGDIRDQQLLRESLNGVDSVIHLACISNDPSFELNPDLGKSINFDAFEPLVKISKEQGVRRFIYASSSSVYGLKEEAEVHEDLQLEPLTDYSKFKALCEEVLFRYGSNDFTTMVIRPATVCGYSPRMRLDLTVNILTNHAQNRGKILVFGGNQQRPNIHIQDMTDLYIQTLEWSHEQIHKKIYNVGYENHTINEIAGMVQERIGDHVEIEKQTTDDHRSYRISSKKIENELGFQPKHTIAEAVSDLRAAFDRGDLPNSFEDSRYFNIKKMQEVNLK